MSPCESLAASRGVVRDPGLAVTLALTAYAERVALDDLFRPTRGEVAISEARHIAMYLAHVVLRHDAASLSRVFGRDPRSVRHAVRRVEDRRDAPDFDRRLARLEDLIAALAAPAPEEETRR